MNETMKQPFRCESQPTWNPIERWSLVALGAIALVLCGAIGCATSQQPLALTEAVNAMSTNLVRLNPGDVVSVTFPGAGQMNTTERVRLDGNILMPLVNEIPAAGKTPSELQADLVKAYDKHLQVKEVVVIVSSSSASIFVSGAVNHPGRITMERPMTILDAIMEAGGFDPRRANMKKVAVIRKKGGSYSRRIVNMKPVLKGINVPPVNLEPFDIIFVPEKLF